MAEVSMDGIIAYKLGYGGPVKRMLCRFWLHGVCTDRNCPYEHYSRYSEVAFCKFILKNKECPYGAKCMFRHKEDFEDFLIGNNTMPGDTLLAAHTDPAHTDPANYSVDQKDNQDAIVSKIADGTHSLPPHGDNLPLRNRFDGLDIEEVPHSSIVSTPPLPPPPSCCRKKEDFTSSSSLMRKEQPGKKKPAQNTDIIKKTKSNKKSNSNCQMSGEKKEKMTDKQTTTLSSLMTGKKEQTDNFGLMTGKKEQTDNFGQTEKKDGADKPINSASLEKNAVNPSSDTFGLLAGAIKSGSGKIFSFSDNEDDNNAIFGFLKDHMYRSYTLEEVKIIASSFYETQGEKQADKYFAAFFKGQMLDEDFDWKKAAVAKSSKSK